MLSFAEPIRGEKDSFICISAILYYETDSSIFDPSILFYTRVIYHIPDPF